MSTVIPEVGTSIDPRIRARRIEVARGAGRKRLRRLSIIGACVAVAAVLAGLTQSPLLDVDEIRVTGAEHAGGASIRKAASIGTGDPLIGIDLGAATRRVEALPWVDTAAVTRTLGGEVAIAVTERVPAAAIAQVSGVVLVDEHGRVLDLAPVTPTGMLTIDGLDKPLVPGQTVPPDAVGALAVVRRFAALLPGRANAVAVGDELTVSLLGGAVVRLGDAAQLDAKLLAVKTVLEGVDGTCMATLDVRLPGNPVLTRDLRCR